MYDLAEFAQAVEVAPFVGAWIEISSARQTQTECKASLRSSERGLKSSKSKICWGLNTVAPFVGAWIEI